MLEANPRADQGLAGLLASAETPEQVARTLTVYFADQSDYVVALYHFAFDPEDPRGNLDRLPDTARAEE